jgi:hypothetical protein
MRGDRQLTQRGIARIFGGLFNPNHPSHLIIKLIYSIYDSIASTLGTRPQIPLKAPLCLLKENYRAARAAGQTLQDL